MPMLKTPHHKYKAYQPIPMTDRQWPQKAITQAPIWLATDLRDGNQSLIEPMDVVRKKKMFATNIKVGVKEIEIGFPSASQTDFDFVRSLIEERLIPNDVWIQVLSPSRAPFIERTFESLIGANQAIFHLYHATAPVMRNVVFGLTQEQVLQEMTIPHVRQVRELMKKYPATKWRFEFSPEMFSNTEIEFSKKVIETVLDEFGATPENKVIINLPTTVENLTPNCFADQIEWIHRNVKKRDCMVLSVHPHNDRGTGTAAAELALMAGADRVEGCLFGNGERTGNVDIVNLALNMYSQGVSPNLDFSDIDEIKKTVEYCNQIPIHPRHPYVGDLVYTSFSGSHQDAIKKAFSHRQDDMIWDMPYLPIDPKDVGRSYEAVIRVNSQSGKGGISYLLQSEYGVDLPRRMQIEFSSVVQQAMDTSGKEFTADDIWNVFDAEYLRRKSPYEYVAHNLAEDSRQSHAVAVTAEVTIDGQLHKATGHGNGPIDAFVAAIASEMHAPVKVMDYHEHSIGSGANATAITYIEMRVGDGPTLHGVGMDSNIVTASFKAILSGLNRDAARKGATEKAKAMWRPMFTIRRATPADADDIARTHCASWRTTYPGLIPDSVIAQWADETARAKKWREIMESEADTHQATWLAFDETHACLGFANASKGANADVKTEGQLRAIYLLQSAQGRGVGRALAHTAFAWMHAQGFCSACVEVLKDNPAEAFYRRLGGENVFTTVFEMGGHPLTEHIYVWETLDDALLREMSGKKVAP